jgi:serine/threonine-protein kinase RsbW
LGSPDDAEATRLRRRMATEPSSQIVLQATVAELAALERWVAKLAAEFGLPPALVHRLDLCVTEIVTNVIGHGYPDGSGGTVSIRFWRQPEQILIRIDDDGKPFDPTSYVSPELPSSLSEASDGGRGIRLVRHFADGLHYLRDAAVNQLTVVFRCQNSACTRTPPIETGPRSLL